MKSKNGITKYYVGLAILLILVVGALVFALTQASDAKTDRQTNKAVEKISAKLDSYVSQNYATPDSLAKAGLSDMPATIDYTKLSDSQYKICIDYKAAAGGFDASWLSLLGGAFPAAQPNTATYPGQDGYFNSYVEFQHKKGENCQTVKPFLLQNGTGSNLFNYNNSNLFTPNTSARVTCSDSGSAVFVGFMTVKSINTSLNSITFTSGDTVSSPGSQPPNATIRSYDSSTVFCTASGTSTTVASLKAGDYVTVYSKSNTDSTIARLDVSQ